MNAEATAVVEKDSEENKEESCKECGVVELGIVSEDTQGGWGPYWDWGGGYRWWP